MHFSCKTIKKIISNYDEFIVTAPNGENIGLRSDIAIGVLHDWMTMHDRLIVQRKVIKNMSATMIGTGVVLFGAATYETVKKIRAKKASEEAPQELKDYVAADVSSTLDMHPLKTFEDEVIADGGTVTHTITKKEDAR